MINDHHILRDFKPRFATVRHKRKVPFSPQITVSPDFSRRLLRIRELDFQLGRFILKAKDYAEIATEAYAANIHWSTKLEGNPLSEEEVRRITRSTLQGEMIEQRNGPIQEIINHALFHAGEESIPRDWEEAWICSLHRTLLDGTGSTAAIGSLRTTETSVYENGPERTEIFRPCPGPHVAAEMASLLKWLRETAPAFDPIVAAALFFHEFESIHPFEDGNGRIHRFLIHNILARRKFIPAGLIFPVSAALLKNLADYDESLESFSRPLLALVEYSLDEQGRMTVQNDTANWYRFIDLTPQAEALFRFVEQTIDTELVEELAFLANYDRTKKAIQEIVDMPDRKIDLFIQACLQNNGRLSAQKRASPFEFLSDEEVTQMEAAIRSAYGTTGTVFIPTNGHLQPPIPLGSLAT